ncbi:MAG: hypothetical protein MRY77_01850 [Rhodobacteraceae bacterium]|nr:hypothetical protein [Paracoccaceae bacterium]
MTTYTFDAYAVYSSRTSRTIVGTENEQKVLSLVVPDGEGTFALEQPIAQSGVFSATINGDFFLHIDGEGVPTGESYVLLLNANWRAASGAMQNSQFAILALPNSYIPALGWVNAEYIVPISGAPLPELFSQTSFETFMNGIASYPAFFPGLTVGPSNSLSSLTTQVTENDYVDLNASPLKAYSSGIGDDTITGATGAETLDGGPGNDLITPKEQITGRIRSAGGEGNDTLIGGRGQDSLAGDGGDDELQGNDGYDRLEGGDGDDTLYGGRQSDTLIGGAGTDYLLGGEGFDHFEVDDSPDHISGGAGGGRLLYVSHTDAPLHIDFDRGIVPGVASISNIRSARTTNHDDILIGGGFEALGGDDVLFGSSENDYLSGGRGNDTILGGDGFDTVQIVASLRSNSAIVHTEAGLYITHGDETDFIGHDIEEFFASDGIYTREQVLALPQGNMPLVEGTDASETIVGGAGAEEIRGGSGSDWIIPGSSGGILDGGAWRDMLDFSAQARWAGTRWGEYSLDIDLTAGTARKGAAYYDVQNFERVTGTIFSDRFAGSHRSEEFRGLGGYDWFTASRGADTLDGGTGRDMVSFVNWTSAAQESYHDPLDPSGAMPDPITFSGVVVDLEDPSNNTHLAARHELRSIERITGSTRQDLFIGDERDNDFRGLGGYDWFVGSAGGRERYFGGSGLDTVTYFRSTAGVEASLRNGRVIDGKETGFGSRGDAAQDLYFDIENLVGTGFDDQLSGNSGANQLSGLGGDDILFGYAGRDKLRGGTGDDTIDGGAGVDYAYFEGQSTDYTVMRTDHRNVTVAGADGTDQLQNVEYFVFDDATLELWSLALA